MKHIIQQTIPILSIPYWVLQRLGYLLVWGLQSAVEFGPHAPLYLWKRANDPIGTANGIIWLVIHICYALFLGAIPWVLRSSFRAGSGAVSRRYWPAYERAKDVRRQQLTQRRRALTRIGMRTPPQAQCTFLANLPGEIRKLIYEMYFEHDKLMVVPEKRYLWTRAVGLTVRIGEVDDHGRKVHGDASGRAKSGRLSLTLTCKQM